MVSPPFGNAKRNVSGLVGLSVLARNLTSPSDGACQRYQRVLPVAVGFAGSVDAWVALVVSAATDPLDAFDRSLGALTSSFATASTALRLRSTGPGPSSPGCGLPP